MQKYWKCKLIGGFWHQLRNHTHHQVLELAEHGAQPFFIVHLLLHRVHEFKSGCPFQGVTVFIRASVVKSGWAGLGMSGQVLQAIERNPLAR